MEFEWDPAKAAANLKDHGVGFTEAMTIFGDPFELTIADPDHSESESRFLSIGASATGRLLVVAYTARNERAAHGSSVHVRQRLGNEGNMRPQSHPNDSEDMRPEYDFSQGVRGRHYEAYRAGTNVVFLDADVAQAFPDSASVNQALRLLVKLAKRELLPKGRPNKALQPTSRGKRKTKTSSKRRSRAARG